MRSSAHWTRTKPHLSVQGITFEVKGKGHPRTGHEGLEGEYRYRSTLSFTSALGGVGGQRHVSAALPRERPSTRCIGLGGPQVGLDRWGKSRPHRDLIPGPSGPWRVAIPTELSRPTGYYIYCIKIYFLSPHACSMPPAPSPSSSDRSITYGEQYVVLKLLTVSPTPFSIPLSTVSKYSFSQLPFHKNSQYLFPYY
jgi:hypothetical protein